MEAEFHASAQRALNAHRAKEHALQVCTKVRSEVEDKKAQGFSFYWFVVRIGPYSSSTYSSLDDALSRYAEVPFTSAIEACCLAPFKHYAEILYLTDVNAWHPCHPSRTAH